MSDYGAWLEISKVNKLSISEQDLDVIKETISEVKSNGCDYPFLNGDPIYQICKTSLSNIIVIRLSEYWYVEGNSDDLFEFTYENDIFAVEKIVEEFKKLLPSTYSVKYAFKNW